MQGFQAFHPGFMADIVTNYRHTMSMDESKEKITIYVIEQNAFVRRAICDWIEDMFVDRFSVTDVEPCDEPHHEIPKPNVDLVLLDLDLLRKNNFIIYQEMRKIYPNTKVILMSTEEPLFDSSKLLGEAGTTFINKFNLHDELYPLLDMFTKENERGLS